MAGDKVEANSEFDIVDEAVSKIAKDVQIKKYGKFLEEYEIQLQDIEDALDECISDAWDSTIDPVSLQFLPYERTTLIQLVSSDNKMLNKIMIVLAALCEEISHLNYEAEITFFNGLLFYGEGDSRKDIQEGDAQIHIGRFVAFLQELSNFVNRCHDVIRNVLQQLSSLYPNNKKSKVIDVMDVHFLPVYEHLGDLLVTLITLDEIIEHQDTLKDHWTLYKRVIKAVRPNPAKFGVTSQNLKPFEKLLMRLENHLFNGKIFQFCVQQNNGNGFDAISQNKCFMEEFATSIKLYFTDIESKIGEFGETNQRHKIIGIFGLYSLHFNIFQNVDRKMFRLLWDIYKKVPAIHLIGNILWFPDIFLVSKLPEMAKAIDKKVQSSVAINRQQHLQNKTQSLARDTHNFYLQVAMWMIKMESAVVEQKKLDDELNKHCGLYVQGVFLAYSIRHVLTTVMNLHVTCNKAMNKTSVLALCRLMELLQAIQFTYHRHTMFMVEFINHIVQHLSFITMIAVKSAKKRATGIKKSNSDICISALGMAEKALNGSGTKERRLVVNLALPFGLQTVKNNKRIFRDEEWSCIQKSLNKLQLICDLYEKLQKGCDCSFFYWHRIIFPVYLSHLFENPVEAHRLQYMFGALRCCIKPLLVIRHESSPKGILNSFENEIVDQLKTYLVMPLCQGIETDLRLHIHSHFHLDDRNPFRVGSRDLSPFLRIRSICFFDKMIHIKGDVERYIEKTFYNLTTVALHDWRTYGEMRSLARQKYGLFTIDDHLPSQTLEQGLDVLEIMRNIHVFVVKYLYNLNNQIFIEKYSNNKHLNTINIRHIANSIRTHGSGIMNTTVNFTYQFLRKKFYIFSQFMYDEHIKSRLIKDLRYFKEIKAQNDDKYPFDRADKFNRGIRKLGLTSDGQSYLDQFRQLISHIGNAMGYVRMIRSGGLHCCYNAVRFIPDLEDIVNFEELCKEEGLSKECQEAAQKLDSVISNLVKSFEGTEYFKLLVRVFAPVFRDSKNIHLRNFHIIIPPLTINFVEHSIACKDSLSRKNKQDAAFTDDGFAMGVAYILKLLNLDHEFDSLHWFQSVSEKYRKEQEQLKRQQQSSNGRDDEKLQQTMTLTAKRLSTYKREFDLLYYSLSSARIFFRTEVQVHSCGNVHNDTRDSETEKEHILG